MQYALAAALVDGGVGLRSFEDAMVVRSDIQELLPRIDVRAFATGSPEAAAGLAGGDGHVRVVLHMRDGRQLQQLVRYARGAPENPVSTAEVVAKFRDCAAGRLTTDQAQRAVDHVVRLREAPNLTGLMESLVVVPVAAGA
jgi:2-methylcitrate dehydratase PrpD